MEEKGGESERESEERCRTIVLIWHSKWFSRSLVLSPSHLVVCRRDSVEMSQPFLVLFYFIDWDSGNSNHSWMIRISCTLTTHEQSLSQRLPMTKKIRNKYLLIASWSHDHLILHNIQQIIIIFRMQDSSFDHRTKQICIRRLNRPWAVIRMCTFNVVATFIQAWCIDVTISHHFGERWKILN